MINRVVLVGRLTKDPELRYTPNGVAVTSITLAVNRPFSTNREADFINCVVWKKQAENVANYLRKGSLTGVEGRMQTRNYENNEGKKVYITEVVADSVQFLEPKNAGGNQGGGDNYASSNQGGYPDQKQQQKNQQNQGRNNQSLSDDPFASDGKPIDISDDDLPF